MERFGDAKEIGEELRQAHGRGTRKEGLLAALPLIPFALWALSLAISPRLHVGIIVPFPAAWAIVVLAVAIYAWRKGIPLWSYSWLGVASFLVPILFDLLVSFVISTLTGLSVREVWSLPIWGWLVLLLFYGSILLVIALLFLRRGWPAASCVALSWGGTMVLCFQEEVLWPQRPIFIVAVCLFWAVATILFVIGPRRLRAMGLAGGVGALIAADAIARWRYALPGNRPAPLHELILLALFLLGPALAMAKGRMGQLVRG
jgi:hypothetical protein